MTATEPRHDLTTATTANRRRQAQNEPDNANDLILLMTQSRPETEPDDRDDDN
jgi:hypothetical protein